MRRRWNGRLHMQPSQVQLSLRLPCAMPRVQPQDAHVRVVVFGNHGRTAGLKRATIGLLGIRKYGIRPRSFQQRR